MKHQKFLLLAFILVSLVVLNGCNIPFFDNQPQNVEQMVQTYLAQTQAAQQKIESIVAQTLTAMPGPVNTSEPTEVMPSPPPTETASATLPPTELPSPTVPPNELPSPTLPPTELPSPTLPPTEPPTLTPTLLPTLAATVTPSVTLVEVSVATNCRTGPGRIFDFVSVLDVGKQVEVVGRSANSTYWVVKNPGGTGTCWLWGNYATVTGPTAGLPVWASPPTPTPQVGVTPTLTTVTLQVSVPTNCRVGPGKVYDIVSVLRPGKTVRVVARHATADFWVVENPEGVGECWVWGEHAKLTGSPANLPIRNAPPTPTPGVGATPTPTSVSLTVSVPTNCRSGPGKAYDIISVLQPGKRVNVVARHGSADYWVIENPAGAGNCWLWGEHAKLTGSTANLPIWAPPPTPTPAVVTLKVRVDTNCRTGPGKSYDIVTILRIGTQAEVIARHPLGTYWVIKNPIASGHCWVWGQYATLTGPSGNLPVWDPSPTPTPKP